MRDVHTKWLGLLGWNIYIYFIVKKSFRRTFNNAV